MTISIRKPDDFHLHLREGEALKAVAPFSQACFARGLVMPNTSPPICDSRSLCHYRDAIVRAGFSRPLMSFKIRPDLTRQTLISLKEAGVLAGKYYPVGVTTNAEDGLSHWTQVSQLLGLMEEMRLPLLVHGEDPHAFCLDRERAFLPQLREIVETFPRLKVVLEHVSTREGVEAVKALPARVGATVTAHHLLFSLDDLLGGKLAPHLFCKPLLGTSNDRQALREVVFSSHQKFFFGSDSAPHAKEAKESSRGAAGVFSAPTALLALAELFDEVGKLEQLEDFVSRFGAEFYGLPLNQEVIHLEKCCWEVPASYGDFIPMKAGDLLHWRLQLNEGP